MAEINSLAPFGSPPRGWGRRAAGAARVGPGRFTPTRVGTTTRGLGLSPVTTVHPHAGGDDATASVAHPFLDRFTPTRVGTTPRTSRAAKHRTVHPHAGGDDGQTRASTRRTVGSPPRGWGRLLGVPLDGTDGRFTPTRVGTTTLELRSVTTIPVHPHAGGDDGSKITCSLSGVGSPPRGWGRRMPSSTSSRSLSGSPPRGWGRRERGDVLVNLLWSYPDLVDPIASSSS